MRTMTTATVCAGVRCGIEGTIHATANLFDLNNWGILLFDANNTFISINRVSILWNTCILWPRASTIIFNTYRGRSSLIVKGSSEILYSSECVIHGDPLSMFLYAIGTIPLIHHLESTVTQMLLVVYML